MCGLSRPFLSSGPLSRCRSSRPPSWLGDTAVAPTVLYQAPLFPATWTALLSCWHTRQSVMLLAWGVTGNIPFYKSPNEVNWVSNCSTTQLKYWFIMTLTHSQNSETEDLSDVQFTVRFPLSTAVLFAEVSSTHLSVDRKANGHFLLIRNSHQNDNQVVLISSPSTSFFGCWIH